MFPQECVDENSYADDIFLKTVLRNVYQQLQQEELSKQTLELYKQLKLDKELQNSRIQSVIKQDLLYSNKSKIDEITTDIQNFNINYPQSFAKLTDIKNFNHIVTNHELKKKHVKSAFGIGS